MIIQEVKSIYVYKKTHDKIKEIKKIKKKTMVKILEEAIDNFYDKCLVDDKSVIKEQLFENWLKKEKDKINEIKDQLFNEWIGDKNE